MKVRAPMPVLIVAVLALHAPRLPAEAPAAQEWIATEDGLHVAVRATGSAMVVLVRVCPGCATLRVMRPEGPLSARDAAARVDAAAVINGGYFDAQGRPIGWLVADGRELSPPGRAGWGAFVVKDGKPSIVAPGVPARGATQALQAGPRLVIAGKPNPRLKPQSARRSFVGMDGEGRVVIGTTGPSSVDASELAAFLARPEANGGAGLVDVLNLDGGSSAQLHVRGVPGGDLDFTGIPVPVLIAIVPVAASK